MEQRAALGEGPRDTTLRNFHPREFPARSGNKQLKNALFRSAWIASYHHPASKAYYQKKRAQGKKHHAAVICLARRRCDAIYTMLRHGTFYEAKPALAA